MCAVWIIPDGVFLLGHGLVFSYVICIIKLRDILSDPKYQVHHKSKYFRLSDRQQTSIFKTEHCKTKTDTL